jgi:hypothetical protein
MPVPKFRYLSVTGSRINCYNFFRVFMCRAIMRQLSGRSVVSAGRRAVELTTPLVWKQFNLDSLVATNRTAIVATIEPASDVLSL